MTRVTANSERGEHVGINASFENASGNNNILHVSNVNDETRHNNPDEVSELSVPETHFDRQTRTHHSDQFGNRFHSATSKNADASEPFLLVANCKSCRRLPVDNDLPTEVFMSSLLGPKLMIFASGISC